MSDKIFFDRRSGGDRRSGREQRENPRLDLPHRQRRREDRRTPRSLAEDYYAFHEAEETPGPAGSPAPSTPPQPRRELESDH